MAVRPGARRKGGERRDTLRMDSKQALHRSSKNAMQINVHGDSGQVAGDKNTKAAPAPHCFTPQDWQNWELTYVSRVPHWWQYFACPPPAVVIVPPLSPGVPPLPPL